MGYSSLAMVQTGEFSTMKHTLAVLILIALLPAPALAGDGEPNVIFKAIGWVADAIITKPLTILGDVIEIGGNVVNMRARLFTWEKKSDGSVHFAFIDIDPRSKEQREADNAESNYAPEYDTSPYMIDGGTNIVPGIPGGVWYFNSNIDCSTFTDEPE